MATKSTYFKKFLNNLIEYKKSINDKNEIIICKKKNKIFVEKIFSDQNTEYLKNEILGYKYFGKKNYFNIPKLYSYNLKKKLKKIVIEYIDGDKISFLDFFKIYKKKNISKKKFQFLNIFYI